MGTVLDRAPAWGQATAEARPGRDQTASSAVIIGGRLSYLALGTLIAAAMGCAGSVYVLMDREDPRVRQLAEALGAVIIPPGLKAAELLGAICASSNVVVAMAGDGSHDPALLPELLGSVRDGCDLAVGSRGAGEASVYAASSCRVARRLKPRHGEDLGHQMLEHAKGEGLAIRFLGLGRGLTWLSEYRVGVVVPAYNEEALIGETLQGIPEYVSKIYVVDDGSTDGTAAAIRGSADPRLVSVRHERNRGVGAAIGDGYRLALADGLDIVAVMAGDNQMDPAELPRLLEPIAEGLADYTKGNRLASRKLTIGMSGWRRFGNYLLTAITKIGSGYWDIMDPQNGYTAISRRALQAIDLDALYTYYGYCNDILIKLNAAGLRVADVPMPARYGRERSKIRYGRYILRVAPMIFRGFLWRLRTKYASADLHPLVLFYWAGMILAPLGLALLLLALAASFLAPQDALGGAAVASILLIGGLQCLFLGMLLDRQELFRARGW